MTLKELRITYENEVTKLPMSYKEYSITALANRLRDAFKDNDAENKNIFASALLLRFWFQINKVYEKVKTAGVDKIEILDRIYECIQETCQEGIWITKPYLNAEQAINQKIATRVAAAIMYESNLHKHRSNVNTISLESTISNTDEDGNTFLDLLEDPTDIENTSIANDFAHRAIQTCIDNKKIIEAILLDNIAFTDCYRDVKVKELVHTDLGSETITKTRSEFWEHDLVTKVAKLPVSYLKSFSERYEVQKPELAAVYKVLTSANNQKIYRYLRSTLSKCRKLPIFNQALSYN